MGQQPVAVIVVDIAEQPGRQVVLVILVVVVVSWTTTGSFDDDREGQHGLSALSLFC
jgi:hypothetical protein